MFPGQGSQQVGMGKALSETYAVARETFAEADEALGESLSQLCFAGDPATLALTANTQPAILTCSVAALRVLQVQRPDLQPQVCLGHSLGEFSALVAAGALGFADAVRLVRLRGQAMQEAVAPGVGAMAAILRVPADDLENLCAEASSSSEMVAIANENGGGQLVVAGHQKAVERLCEAVKVAKGRAIALDVSAPFHCSLMQPAADRLAQALGDIEVSPLKVPVIANVDAEPNAAHERVKELLVAQVTGRVRWEASVQKAVAIGVTHGIELGHGKVLAGLCRRIDRSLKVTPLGQPADVQTLEQIFPPA